MILLWLVGCIALPFASPPMEASVSIGASNGAVPPPDNWGSIGSPMSTDVRFGLYPMGSMREFLDRPVDGGGGYVAIYGPQGAFTHGPYLEFRAHPWLRINDRSKGPTATRFAVGVTGELLHNPSAGWGFGTTIGVSFEHSVFADGPFDGFDTSGGVLGYAYGEAGIGGGLEATIRSVPGYTWVGFAFRGRLRLPASAGLLFVPIT